MDLIYMNDNKEDVGVLLDYELDLAFGVDENNFECRIQANSHCCKAGYYLYFEGTEYGGIVDSIESNTLNSEVIYSGRTWHGILGSKIVLPLQSGETSTANVTVKEADNDGNSLVDRYLIISGDANACIQFVLDRIGLSDMFTSSSEVADVNIDRFQFIRYTDAYSGLVRMLASEGLKLKVEFQSGNVVLSAVPKYDYSQDEEFDSDQVDIQVKKNYKPINHLICLGKGELEERLVVHLYADEYGNISDTQTQFGMDEITAIYDYSSVESAQELVNSGTDELRKLCGQDELSIDFDNSSDAYDVGDVVGAVDNVTGITVASTITKKIVTIKNGQITIDLSTDAVSSGGSGSSGSGNVQEDTNPYPVGSIYMSVVDVAPDVYFGGTWERIEGKFLLAADADHEVGSTGGEAEHTLSVDEIPIHDHASANDAGYFAWGGTQVTDKPASATSGSRWWTSLANIKTSTTGGGLAHNNMPPYLAVYIWKRIA